MKHLLLLISFFTLTFASSVECQEAEWTMLVYMVGSDLETNGNNATLDINEMLAGATTTANSNIILLTGGANKAGWETPKSWKIENGQQVELSFVPSNTNMANPSNVTEFIDWGIDNYPAERTMIVFWNHGGGTRGFGWAEPTYQHLSVPQLKQAFENSAYIQNGNQFDIIGFDACLMATLEVMHNLQDFGIFMVSSEETEPFHGWNYTPFMDNLENGNALHIVSGEIMNAYFDQVDAYQTSKITLSIVDLGEISILESSIEALFDKISTEGKMSSLQKAVSASEEYGKKIRTPEHSSDLVDIGDLMRKLRNIDPSLATEANQVLSRLNSAISGQNSDHTRPNASGISIYIPHNALSDEAYLQYKLQGEYAGLNLPANWNNFIVNEYIPFVTADDEAPGFKENEIRGNNNDFSSLTITHDDDLEHVHIVLDEEFLGIPDEYLLLGSTVPDSIEYVNDSTETYYYFWDEEWLGINGHPAYVADIHDFYVEDELGNLTHYDRVHIPAILNWGTLDEKSIMLSYLYDDDFNYTLEGISVEPSQYGDVIVESKDRVILEPGDQVYLLYEVFNEITDEEFFIVDEDAIITIENGNEDLHLEHHQLEPGNYHIGYALLDHSHNDTIIWDDQVFTVVANSVVEELASNEVLVSPNPSNDGFNVSIDEQFYREVFTIVLNDMTGKAILSQQFDGINTYVDTKNIPNGIYSYSLMLDGHRVYIDKIVIQH